MAFVPSDLSSIIAWWRSEDIPSNSPDPLNWDDVVSGWRLSASGTARPTYSATAIGGVPGLVFDGTNDWLKSTTTKSIGGQIYAACVCGRSTGSPTYNGPYALFAATTSPSVNVLHGGYGYLPGGNIDLYVQGYNDRYTASPAADTNHVIVTGKGKQETGLWIDGIGYNGGTVSSGVLTEPTQTVYAHMGNFYDYWKGPISELVYWNESYQFKQRVWIEGYLAWKYGITLPTWHPFYVAAPISGPSSGGISIARGMHGGMR